MKGHAFRHVLARASRASDRSDTECFQEFGGCVPFHAGILEVVVVRPNRDVELKGECEYVDVVGIAFADAALGLRHALDPVGKKAIDRGRGPTFTDLTTLCAATSITNTAPSSSEVTQTRRFVGSTDTPSGSSPILKLSTIAPVLTSTTLALPACSWR